MPTSFPTSDPTEHYTDSHIYPNTAEMGDLLGLFCGVIGPLIIILITIVFCKRLFNIESKTRHKKPYALRLSIGIFITNFLLSATAITQSILLYIGSHVVIYSFIIVSFLNSLLLCLLYLFMMLRIHQTFKNTIYSVSKDSFWCHWIIIIYVGIGIFLFNFLLLADIKGIVKICFIFMILVPFAIGLSHLIYMFNSKLFALVLLQRRAIHSLDQRQLRLLQTIRKHSVLGVFFILTQIGFISLGLILYGINGMDPTANTMIYWIVTDVCMIIESTSLFVGFTDNYKYYLCLCKLCDRGCEDLCISLAINRMKAMGQNAEFSVANVKEIDEEERTKMVHIPQDSVVLKI